MSSSAMWFFIGEVLCFTCRELDFNRAVIAACPRSFMGVCTKVEPHSTFAHLVSFAFTQMPSHPNFSFISLIYPYIRSIILAGCSKGQTQQTTLQAPDRHLMVWFLQ